MSVSADTAPMIPPMPRLAVLLLAGAGLHLAVIVTTRATMNGYLELSPGAVISYGLSAMPLVLAAGLVAGRDRWAAGRRWLSAAAVAFAMVAVVDAAGWIWMSISWPPGVPDGNQAPPLLLRSTLLVAGVIGAPLLVAAGLRAGRARGSRPAIGWLSIVVAAVAIVLSLVPMLAYYDNVFPFFDGQNERPLSAALSAVGHLLPAATAMLGVAAARSLPRRYLVPEALIAVGAMAAALGSAVSASAYLVLRQPEWQALIAPVVVASTGLALLGFAVVALGFFTARISAPGQP